MLGFVSARNVTREAWQLPEDALEGMPQLPKAGGRRVARGRRRWLGLGYSSSPWEIRLYTASSCRRATRSALVVKREAACRMRGLVVAEHVINHWIRIPLAPFFRGAVP